MNSSFILRKKSVVLLLVLVSFLSVSLSGKQVKSSEDESITMKTVELPRIDSSDVIAPLMSVFKSIVSNVVSDSIGVAGRNNFEVYWNGGKSGVNVYMTRDDGVLTLPYFDEETKYGNKKLLWGYVEIDGFSFVLFVSPHSRAPGKLPRRSDIGGKRFNVIQYDFAFSRYPPAKWLYAMIDSSYYSLYDFMVFY